MSITHIEALEECLSNPTISAEAKEHISALRIRMMKYKETRPMDKKSKDNKAVKDFLNAEILYNTEYTMAELIEMVEASGVTSTKLTPSRIAGLIDLDKQKTKVVDASGKKVIIYKRRTT